MGRSFGQLSARLRREWGHQQQQRPRGLAMLVAGGLLISAGVALALTRSSWLGLQQREALQLQRDLGLLDLRINAHKVVALDWGHWDPTRAFVRGEDPGYPERELQFTSILRDGQGLLITGPGGQVLFSSLASSPDRQTAGLQACLLQRLQQLRQRHGQRRDPGAWGFYCAAGHQQVLGAASAVTSSRGQEPAQGWLLHFSQLQRPSYTKAINTVFADIATRLESRPATAKGPGNTGAVVADLGELEPGGRQVILRPGRQPARLGWELLTSNLPVWLACNLLGLAMVAAALLGSRRLRLTQLHDQHRHLQRLQALQRDRLGKLLTPEELLQRARRARPLGHGQAPPPLALAVVHLTVNSYAADQGNASLARDGALTQLSASLQGQSSILGLGLSAGRDLLVLLAPSQPIASAADLRWLEHQVDELQQQLGGQMDLQGRGLLAPLGPEQLEQQLTDLLLVLSSSHGNDSWQVLPEGGAAAAERLREQISTDFDLTRLAQTLAHHGHALEPVVQISNDRCTVIYEEMLFRLPAEMAATIPVQELILALERRGHVHRIDQLMLQRATALLLAERELVLGVNLSALTLQSEQQRRDLRRRLEGLEPEVRQRLVLEITETALSGDDRGWLKDLEQVRALGIRLAMDDFGVGHASLASLFRLRPDFLKLDLRYSQRLQDEDVDALVAFLERYARNHAITLILEGIETLAQLTYWQERGVEVFQGYLFRAPDEEP